MVTHPAATIQVWLEPPADQAHTQCGVLHISVSVGEGLSALHTLYRFDVHPYGTSTVQLHMPIIRQVTPHTRRGL
jgi:hypothetical protein